MNKRQHRLTEKINNMDNIFNELDRLRTEAMLLLSKKNELERKIIKLLKKQHTVDRVETSERIYMLRKKTEINENEETITRLLNYLHRKGKNTKNIREWKNKMFSKARRKTVLVVYKKSD